MKKKTKKAKRITKQAQLRVKTGVKSGGLTYKDCDQYCHLPGEGIPRPRYDPCRPRKFPN